MACLNKECCLHNLRSAFQLCENLKSVSDYYCSYNLPLTFFGLGVMVQGCGCCRPNLRAAGAAQPPPLQVIFIILFLLCADLARYVLSLHQYCVFFNHNLPLLLEATEHMIVSSTVWSHSRPQQYQTLRSASSAGVSLDTVINVANDPHFSHFI